MFEREDLDGVKLVREENLANDVDTLVTIDRAVMQGCGDWGVVPNDAVVLRLANELREALVGSAAADENFRLLKGAQMELGRIKKHRDRLQAELDSLTKAE